MLALFLSAFVVGFSGAIMPGPVMTCTIEKALTQGRHAGFLIVIGHAVLEILLIISILLGFDIILKSQPAQITIGLVGGTLLLYMGLNMIYSAVKNRLSIQTNTNPGLSRKFSDNTIISGFLLSALNPYFIFWWAVIGLTFIIYSYDKLGYFGVLIYFFGHISADFVIYGSLSFLVGSAKKLIQGKAYRIIISILGCAMIGFGAKFLIGAIISIAYS